MIEIIDRDDENSLQRIFPASAAIEWAEYLPARRELAVKLSTGRIAEYADVPPEIVEAFALTPQPARFYIDVLMGWPR